MITINLLPMNALRDRKSGQLFLTTLGIFTLALAVGLLLVYLIFMRGHLASLDSQIFSQQTRLAELSGQMSGVNQLTASTIKKWRQFEAIAELEERRRDQTRILVELDKLLPRSSAWLLSLEHSDGLLTIVGISKDKEVVSQFLSRLENAAYIDRNSVNLVEVAQNMVINRINLTRFKITARTVFPRPAVLNGMPELGLPSQAEMNRILGPAESSPQTGGKD